MSAWPILALAHAAIDGEYALVKVAAAFELKKETPKEALQRPQENSSDRVEAVTTDEDISNTEESANSSEPWNSVFPYIIKQELIERKDNSLEDNGYTITAYVPDDTLANLSFIPPFPILLPRRYLNPSLNMIGHLSNKKPVDEVKLARKISTGKPLYKLPKVEKTVWPNRLVIVLDYSESLLPFRLDFENIADKVVNLLGKDSASAVVIDEESLGTAWLRYRIWSNSEGLSDLHYGSPIAGAETILILSELGARHDRSEQLDHSLTHWLIRHIRPWQEVLTFTPTTATHRLSKAKELNAVSLIDNVPLPRNSPAPPVNLSSDEVAENDLLELVSYLPLVTPGLLREIRRVYGLGSSDVEWRVWNCPDLEVVHFGKRLRQSCAVELQKKYQQKWRSRADEFWKISAKHLNGHSEGLTLMFDLMRYEAESPEEGDALYQDVHEKWLPKLRSLANIVSQPSISENQQKAICRAAYQSLPLNFSDPELRLDLGSFGYLGASAGINVPEEVVKHQQKKGVKSEKADEFLLIVQRSAFGGCELTGFETLPKTSTASQNINSIVNFEVPKGFRIGKRIWENTGIGSFDNLLPGKAFVIKPGKNIELTSYDKNVSLGAFHKPTWAAKMAYRNNQLYAIPKHFPESCRLTWSQIATSGNETLWGWHYPEVIKEIGEDEYGTYLDLNFGNVTQRLRWIEPGEFIMGSPESDPDRDDDETQHPVTLTQGFWLADTATSQQLWQGFEKNNPSKFKNNEHPVEQVSWDDVQKWLARVAEKTGLSLRLPTEAEWEYACRADKQTRYSWGDEITPENANYASDGTKSVKAFAPNPWGLYQMHGNVLEWCHDWYGDYPVTAVDPEGPPDGARRVLRGGSWFNYGRHLRCAIRYRYQPVNRFEYIGFRLALGHELKSGGAAVQGEAAAEQQARPVKPGGGLGKLIKEVTGKK